MKCFGTIKDLGLLNNTNQKLSNGDYPGMLDYYTRFGVNGFQHQQMAQHYRGTIADIIQKFDNNRLSRSIYEVVAWAGLGTLEDGQTSIAWNNLSVSERIIIESAISQNFFKGPSNCN